MSCVTSHYQNPNTTVLEAATAKNFRRESFLKNEYPLHMPGHYFPFLRKIIFYRQLQKGCGYAGITREEGLPYVRSVRKV